MAVSLTVTAKGLRDTAAKLRALNQRLENELNSMSTRESSLNGMWDGQANDAFHAAYRHDVQEYNDFIQAIEEYIRALLQAADEYERTEQRNQSIAASRSYGAGGTTSLYIVNTRPSVNVTSPLAGSSAGSVKIEPLTPLSPSGPEGT